MRHLRKGAAELRTLDGSGLTRGALAYDHIPWQHIQWVAEFLQMRALQRVNGLRESGLKIGYVFLLVVFKGFYVSLVLLDDPADKLLLFLPDPDLPDDISGNPEYL